MVWCIGNSVKLKSDNIWNSTLFLRRFEHYNVFLHKPIIYANFI